MDTVLDYLWEQLRYLDLLFFFFFLVKRETQKQFCAISSMLPLHPHKSVLSLGALANTRNTLSKVDKEKWNSGLIPAFIKTSNFLTLFLHISHCSDSNLAHGASLDIQFLWHLGHLVSPTPTFSFSSPRLAEYTVSLLFAIDSNWLFKKTQ